MRSTSEEAAAASAPGSLRSSSAPSRLTARTARERSRRAIAPRGTEAVKPLTISSEPRTVPPARAVSRSAASTRPGAATTITSTAARAGEGAGRASATAAGASAAAIATRGSR